MTAGLTDVTVVVLAGGLGSRLGRLSAQLPKALALVDGRPFLDLLLGEVEASGVRDVIIAVGHMRDEVMSHVGSRFGSMSIRYSVETEPLGTGGAIRQALVAVTTSDVVVMNGDTLAGVDLVELVTDHRSRGSALTMAVVQVPDVARYGAVRMKRMTALEFREKGDSGPGWINAGTYVLGAEARPWLELSPPFSFEYDVLAARASETPIPVNPAAGPFIDIGTPEDLERAQGLLKVSAG
jgi:D-glycero-alpha-D-manno-heptose 1-phosphate guanylyltransferase